MIAMSEATETLTIHLPVEAVRRPRRVAEISQRAVDEVIAETLDTNLPPLLKDIPAAFQAELATLETLSTDHLRQEVYATIDPDQLTRYDALLAANTDGSLDQAGQEDLAMLRMQADRLMFRKAYAALLLKWRGERVPTPAEIETKQR